MTRSFIHTALVLIAMAACAVGCERKRAVDSDSLDAEAATLDKEIAAGESEL